MAEHCYMPMCFKSREPEETDECLCICGDCLKVKAFNAEMQKEVKAILETPDERTQSGLSNEYIDVLFESGDWAKVMVKDIEGKWHIIREGFWGTEMKPFVDALSKVLT